jgi:hypothetical protein
MHLKMPLEIHTSLVPGRLIVLFCYPGSTTTTDRVTTTWCQFYKTFFFVSDGTIILVLAFLYNLVNCKAIVNAIIMRDACSINVVQEHN